MWTDKWERVQMVKIFVSQVIATREHTPTEEALNPQVDRMA